MPGVFISYRREDSEGHSGRLFDDLKRKYGQQLVFFDVATIPIGVNFREFIEEKVGSCSIMLVIIGKNWISVTNKDGKHRLKDKDDFVRLEISTALRRKIPVVPVLVQGTIMPSAPQLPSDIRELVERNAFSLRHDRWELDVDLLAKKIAYIMQKKPHANNPILSSLNLLIAGTTILLLVYSLIISLAMVNYHYLLTLFFLISVIIGFLYSKNGRSSFWVGILPALALAAITLMGILLENYLLYTEPFWPQSFGEWLITLQFATSICLGFVCGAFIARFDLLRRPSLS